MLSDSTQNSGTTEITGHKHAYTLPLVENSNAAYKISTLEFKAMWIDVDGKKV